MTFKTNNPDLAGYIRQLVREQVEEQLQQLRAPAAPVVVTEPDEPPLAPDQTGLANALADHLGQELSDALVGSTRRFLRQHGLSAGLYDHSTEASLSVEAGHLDPCVVDQLRGVALRDLLSEAIGSLVFYPAKPARKARLY